MAQLLFAALIIVPAKTRNYLQLIGRNRLFLWIKPSARRLGGRNDDQGPLCVFAEDV
jgi:hypothetical protein